MQELKDLSYSDLWAMFQFVSQEYNKSFGPKTEAKRIIHERHAEIVNELNERTYGGNPYNSEKVEINGVVPESVDLKQFDAKAEAEAKAATEAKAKADAETAALTFQVTGVPMEGC